MYCRDNPLHNSMASLGSSVSCGGLQKAVVGTNSGRTTDSTTETKRKWSPSEKELARELGDGFPFSESSKLSGEEMSMLVDFVHSAVEKKVSAKLNVLMDQWWREHAKTTVQELDDGMQNHDLMLLMLISMAATQKKKLVFPASHTHIIQ